MPRYGIAPQLSSHWFPQGTPHEVSSHHCGKCMNPFLSGADCSCACHAKQGGAHRTVVPAGLEHPVEGLDRDNITTPVAGAEREGKQTK